MDLKRFDEDLTALLDRMCKDDDEEIRKKVQDVKSSLVEMYKKNLVKINHSALELVCARHMITLGYSVEVEHKLSDVLVCDVFGKKGSGTLIVEIETGFVPPENALEPSTYNNARIASKIARYSSFAHKFALASPPTYLLNIPDLFEQPPRYRKLDDTVSLKKLCDKYYNDPEVSVDQLLLSRLHAVFIIDVDRASVQEVDPELYMQKTRELPFRLNSDD